MEIPTTELELDLRKILKNISNSQQLFELEWVQKTADNGNLVVALHLKYNNEVCLTRATAFDPKIEYLTSPYLQLNIESVVNELTYDVFRFACLYIKEHKENKFITEKLEAINN